MLRKALIGVLVVALTPALAFAAPTTMTMRHERPAVTHTLKLKKTHPVKKVKVEKIRLIQKHRTLNKMRIVAHLKHRTLTHKV